MSVEGAPAAGALSAIPPWAWWGGVLICDLATLALVVAHRPWFAFAVFMVPVALLLPQLFIPSTAGFGPVVTHFSTARREVWLTIDDGPDPATTGPVLDLLDAHGAHAAFFLVGVNAAAHPELVAEILRRGHAVGNHTEGHPCLGFWCASPRRVAAEIDRCTGTLCRVGAVPPRWFRPPVGIKNPFLHRLLAARGMDLVAWSARGFDSMCEPSRALARIMRDLRPGAIILVHEVGRGGRPGVALLSQLLGRLAQEGYACVIPPRESLRGGGTRA